MFKDLNKLAQTLDKLGKPKEAKTIRLAIMGPTQQRIQQYQTQPQNKDYLHGILDLLGLVPAYGEGADLLNAGLYLSEGITSKNLLLAGLSLTSMLSGLGDVSKIIKYGESLAPNIVKRIAQQMFQQQGKIKAMLDRLKDPKIAQYITTYMPHGNLLVTYSDRIWDELKKWFMSILKGAGSMAIEQKIKQK